MTTNVCGFKRVTDIPDSSLWSYFPLQFSFSKVFPACRPRHESLNQTAPIPVAWTTPGVQKTNRTPGLVMRRSVPLLWTGGTVVSGWVWGLSRLPSELPLPLVPDASEPAVLVSGGGVADGQRTDCSTKGHRGCQCWHLFLEHRQHHLRSHRYSRLTFCRIF